MKLNVTVDLEDVMDFYHEETYSEIIKEEIQAGIRTAIRKEVKDRLSILRDNISKKVYEAIDEVIVSVIPKAR